MSAGVIIAIVVVVAIVAFVLLRMRAGMGERRLERARTEAAESHRELADDELQDTGGEDRFERDEERQGTT